MTCVSVFIVMIKNGIKKSSDGNDDVCGTNIQSSDVCLVIGVCVRVFMGVYG